MDLQMLAFVTVVEEQSFTRAAEKLHISQPAISQHIQNLEQRLEVKLLDRTSKYVRLNRAGEVVYHHAKEILNRYQLMRRLIEDLKTEASGPLHIGASFTFGEYLLPHIVAAFRRQYPQIQPSITIENTHHVLEEVSRGHLDIGIVEGLSIPEKDVLVIPFAEDTMVLVAASQHPLASKGFATREDLEQECWIVREPGSGTREMTDYVWKTFHIRPKTVIEYATTQVIKESVEAGLGISLLSIWAVRKEQMCDALRTIRFTEAPIQRKFSIVLRKSDFQPKSIQLFKQFLLENTLRPPHQW
ncbi:LysR family transcriptional regulator [Alicyclobacillus herbarius]|uniref:LysR family transcriptional regulator n=1 Tax=Alicyclobacillus herbarius TaxID=122960 RepID=UPI002357BA3D|nr:LysR family transcriptional regulator [Alicyclobacillus herbarius]